MNSADLATTVLEPPKQAQVEEVDSSEFESQKDSDADVRETTTDWTISEDYDMSAAKSKPLPRQSVEPTYRGWKEVGRFEKADELTGDDEATDLLSRGSFFDLYLPAVAYGDWYHNVAYLIGAGLLSWLVGWFRFSLGPVFFVMVIFSILYRSSVRKYRQSLREHAQREFSIRSIENDYETMDWLNVFLEKFWHFLEPSVAQIVTEQVNPILAASPAPAFIKALWLDAFTAGTKPPRIDMVKTLAGTADDVVVMDWGCSFTPNEMADSNNKQTKSKVNQKVTVKANLFGFEVPVTVSDISFKCLLRVRLRMMTAFPHIETVNVSLLEAPQFDFNARLLGDTPFNWEVLAFPGLYPFINEMVKKYVGSIVFSPLSFQLNVQQLMAGAPLNSAIGVLVVTVKSAKDLKNYGRIDNTIDPYCTLGFFKSTLAETKFKPSTSRPVWNQTLHIPISSFSEPLNITVMDYNRNQLRKNNFIGSVQYDLEVLSKENKLPNITVPVVRNNKEVGEMSFGLHFMPTLVAQRQADGAVVPPPDLNTGVARLEVSAARNLKGKDGKPVSTYVEMFVNDEPFIKTNVAKNNNNPGYGDGKEHIVFNRAKTRVKVIVRTKDKKIYSVIKTSLNNLIDATQVDDPWFQLSSGGEIKLSTVWKPVILEGASGAGGYTPPIGVVRIAIDSAEDLRNLESIGKVDPYVRLLVNGIQRARTAAVESSLDPTWNEVHYVTLSSPNQKLTLEAMDVEKMRPDRTLGSFDVILSELINKDEKGNYIETVDPKKRTSKLIHKKGPKGTLTYSLSFYPTLPVMTLDEIKEEEDMKKKFAEEKAKKEKKAADEKAQGKQEEKKKGDEEVEEDESEFDSSHKLKLSLEDLEEYKSGVLAFEVKEVDTSKNDLYLQAFFDNHGLPDYVSPKLREKRNRVNTTGDVIIKELDWSEANFRLVKKSGFNRAEKAIAEATIPTLQLLKNGFHKPMTLDLTGSATAKVSVQVSWIPVIYASEIPPQDTSDNCGHVQIKVVNAEHLPAADRNGKSDPYVKLYLNTEKESFFKSKKVKKSLDPTWNESTQVTTTNKYDSVIRIKCYDWDVGPEPDDLLGIGEMTLTDVNKDEEIEIDVPLFSENDEPAGVVHFKVGFKPDFVLNVRPESSTNIGDAFSVVGSGVGAVGSVGLGVGKGVGKGLGKGVGTVGKGLKMGLHLGKHKE
ncbi:hypothetical protein JCM33374_g1454 [Metschnikowia sp. JCM 33374]|nr:hypothetical protein JCM33374_g1454 [Metschnikowia sp. JCM 33374]